MVILGSVEETDSLGGGVDGLNSTRHPHGSVLERLDELLPAERSADGAPSATDFLLYDLPRIRDQLAADFEGNTLPAEDDPVRVWVGSGVVVAMVALFVYVADDDSIEVVSLLIG